MAGLTQLDMAELSTKVVLQGWGINIVSVKIYEIPDSARFLTSIIQEMIMGKAIFIIID